MNLKPAKLNGRLGYADQDAKGFVIPPMFARAGLFENGIAVVAVLVKSHDKAGNILNNPDEYLRWGVIDLEGKSSTVGLLLRTPGRENSES